MNSRQMFSSATALAVIAGSAAAQSATQWQPIEVQPGSGSERSIVVQAQPEKTQAIFIQRSDSGECKVEISGDDVHATHNGKKIPAERIKRSGEGVKIIGEDGEVIAEFSTKFATVKRRSAVAGGGGGGAFSFGGESPRVIGIPGSSGPFAISTTIDEKPRTIIGVTLGDAAPAVLEHFGLTEGSGVIIDSVMDGFPAQEAGVEAGDIVIAVDGKDGITQDKFREIIGAKKPDDKVKLTIIRKGDRLTVTSGLKEFKQEIAATPIEGFDTNAFQIDIDDPDIKKRFEQAFKDHDFDFDFDAGQLAGPFTVYSDDGKAFTWSMPKSGEARALRVAPPQAVDVEAIESIRRERDELRAQIEEMRASMARERDELREELAAIRRILSDLAKDR